MIYTATILTEANTAKVDATRTVLRVGKGLVWRIEVEFPPGCAGLAHLQIFDGSYQVAPANPDGSFASDGIVIAFDDLYLKESAPYEFTIVTWNLDALFDHSAQVRIGMASSEAFMSRYMPSISWEKFGETLKKAAEQQEKDKKEQIEQIRKDLEG